ncbi:MAG: argininosuccinate lyase, partial [Betaproteobacteria bacterium]|nr:argininosuccinate lyase [Betaproteobacteria bacterium]
MLKMTCGYHKLFTGVALMMACSWGMAQKNGGRDQFFWLGQINKASAVINVDEGLLDRDKAPKI